MSLLVTVTTFEQEGSQWTPVTESGDIPAPLPEEANE